MRKRVQRKLQREQEELAQKQREDLECERKPAENTSAQDQVEEAWRKAQQEAGSRRGRHGSGRHGSPTHGASTGGGGGAPSQHAAVTGLRESRSRSRSPGRDGGGGAHVFSDRGPGGHARVGFADSHAAGYDRGYERGPSGHHGGFQGGSGAGQRPLSSRLPEPGAAQHGHDSVSQKLEQVCAAERVLLCALSCCLALEVLATYFSKDDTRTYRKLCPNYIYWCCMCE